MQTLTIAVTALPPVITLQPNSYKGCVDSTEIFSIEADGAHPITYQWFKNDAILYSERKTSLEVTIRIENLPPSNSDLATFNYRCKVTNPGGSTWTDYGTLELKPQQVAAKIEDITLCNGDNQGTILINATGGWGNYRYCLQTAQAATQCQYTTQTFYDNLPVGNYTIWIIDKENCASTYTYEVTAPPLLEPDIATQNITCYGYNNGTAHFAAVGGTPPYHINLASNLTGSQNLTGLKHINLTGLKPAIFTINITDANQCDTLSVVEIAEPLSLNFDIQHIEPPQCYGEDNARLNFNLSGGTPPYRFYWENQQITKVVPQLKSGNYQLHRLADNPN